MSTLPDHEIEVLATRPRAHVGALIEPFARAQLQPASYDVLLADQILVPLACTGACILDLRKHIPDDLYQRRDISEGYVLYPGQFILGSTIERVCIPDYMVGRIEGKSSIGRLGLTAHITAGYLDPGFRGNVTLEMVNLFLRPIRLWPGVRIAQFSFDTMHATCERPYGSPDLGSHYQDAVGVEPTRYGSLVSSD